MRKLIMLVVVMVIVASAKTQNKTTKPAVVKASAGIEIKKNATVEGITEYELANGLKVLLYPDPSKPTATVNVTYLVGSRHEGYGETGMAHLLEHMVFKGSPRHKNIPQELTSHGARPNGTTSYDRTNYFETFNATDENLDWALDMEADRMVNSFIDEKDLKSEFSVVRNEFESGENDPSGVLMERIMSTAYLWHNYGKSTIGSKEDIERVPIQNLKDFYKKYYQPDNAVLMVAGKIDEQKTLELIKKKFGVIPRPTRKLVAPYTKEPTQDGERFVDLKRVGDVQVVACSYHIPAATHPDYAAIEVLMDILTNEPSGRYYKAMVESKKASRAFGFAFDLHDPGIVYFSADVLKEKSLDSARTTMLSFLDSLGMANFTEEEVKRAKSTILKQLEEQFRNTERVGVGVSQYIALGDWRLGFLFRDAIEKITVEDVRRVAKAYFKSSNRTVGLFLPDKSPDRSIIPATPDVASMVKDYKGRKAMELGEAFDASNENIMARTKTGTIGGGAKFALLTKKTKGNTVNGNISLRIGTEQSLMNKGSIASVTAGLLMKGTTTMTQQQIKDRLDSLKSRVNIFGFGQVVNISFESTRENLQKTLDVINDVLHNPVFEVNEFEKLKQETITGIEEGKSEPSQQAQLEMQQIMNKWPKGHINYTGTIDEQIADIKNVKIEDVKVFYKDFYNSTNATSAVVGDFDEAAVTKSLNTLLANWKAKESYARIPDVNTDNPAQSKSILAPDKANAFFLAAQNLKIKDNSPDYAPMLMANYILGGGFLNSRLAVRIRQKEGISYGVGSSFSARPLDEKGSFIAYAILNPTNAEKLEAAFKEEITKVQTEGFTEQELKDAKSGLLQSFQVSRAQDRSLVSTLSNNLFLNRTLQYNVDLENAIKNLTVTQLNEAIKKHISLEKMSMIKAGDFKKKPF
jgi:zinc protease